MPRAPHHSRAQPGFRYELALDERPRRALTSVNVRFDDKEVFDLVQAHLTAERGRVLSQWDTFGILLGEWLDARAGSLPESLSRRPASALPRR